jgi:iron(III) transport system ATP-binding protein
MGEEFRALQHRLRITCLYVTHDQEEAMALSDRIVVMQHGRVLQVGDPQSIYQRPSSRAVAAFFGSPNLIEATVASCERQSDDLFRLEVFAEDWRGACLASQAFRAGDSVVVMIRPESLQVSVSTAHDAGTTGRWRGEIVDSIFRGARCSIVMRVGKLRLVAEAPALRAAPVGTHVELFADTSETWALRP